ncbi:T9SS type A sorting domain-containing protein [Flavivirga sp. 57AJ16]|uniref:T9SS type A sorting domain-containing protein n=1 Tax=Flavivirga sp. 57AJ16 TaxID=3025307 RepID=UPI002365DA89|nr:T9SS type A sorting domain-containing protein [Flavivirga sp. 57AJ16]MDD7886275.1 T9SS type A sorting domain-containing protein [Flavivirga sp. 57AJ16]
MKKTIMNKYMCLLFIVIPSGLIAQVYVASGAEIHYSGGTFVSGVINNNNGGTFSISENFVHDDGNYVNGPVAITEGGTYNISIGPSAESRVPNVVTTGAATIFYSATTDPATGRNETVNLGVLRILADNEVYTFTGDVSTFTATPLSGTQYNSEPSVSSPVIVYWSGSEWNDTLSGVASFAAQTASLGTEDFNVKDFVLYPNPVNSLTNTLNYQLPNGIEQLSIDIYDVRGKKIQTYYNVPVNMGVNSLVKPKVDQGMYLIRFNFNKGQQQIIKKILIE